MSPRIDSFPSPYSQTHTGSFLYNAHPTTATKYQEQNLYLSALPSTHSLLDNVFLRNFYSLASWAQGNLSLTPVEITQSTIGAVGGYANTQASLDQQYIDQAIKRTPLPWVDRDFINNHFPSDFKPSTSIKTIGILGQSLDAATGVINLSQAFKKDIDSDNNSLSNTLNASIRSVSQISLAGATGVAVAGLAATTAAPVAIGAAAGIATGYATGYLYDKISNWLF